MADGQIPCCMESDILCHGERDSPLIDAFTIEVSWNFDKMQIIFKAVTGRSGHAPWWEGKCGTVRARDAKHHGGSRWLAALESSLC